MTFDQQMTHAARAALNGQLTWAYDPDDPDCQIITCGDADWTNQSMWLLWTGLVVLDRGGTVRVIDVDRCRQEATDGIPV